MKTKIKPKPGIRYDLFSVKVKGNGFNEWCHERIFRNITSARRYKNGLQPFPGYWLETKIVHPAQFVVDAYVIAGNQIED